MPPPSRLHVHALQAVFVSQLWQSNIASVYERREAAFRTWEVGWAGLGLLISCTPLAQQFDQGWGECGCAWEGRALARLKKAALLLSSDAWSLLLRLLSPPLSVSHPKQPHLNSFVRRQPGRYSNLCAMPAPAHFV